MAVARLKGDPRIGITGMRKRIFTDGDLSRRASWVFWIYKFSDRPTHGRYDGRYLGDFACFCQK